MIGLLLYFSVKWLADTAILAIYVDKDCTSSVYAIFVTEP